MVHAALLHLMLEAVTTDLVSTISLKRSTQNLQLSTSCQPITPSLCQDQHPSYTRRNQKERPRQPDALNIGGAAFLEYECPVCRGTERLANMDAIRNTVRFHARCDIH